MMDKFGLYDLFSFLFPGLIFCFLLNPVIPAEIRPFLSIGTIGDGFILTTLSFTLGLGVHRLVFTLLDYKWFKWLLYPDIQKIINYPPKGVYFSKKLRKEKGFEKSPADFFDTAYFKLEKEGKNERVIAFQSFYFFLRNLFVVLSINLPVLIAASLSGSFKLNWAVVLITGLITLFIIRQMAIFYRGKMVERVMGLALSE